MTLYAIQDILIGFNIPMTAANDEAMIRDYKIWAAKNDAGEDKRLFKVGEFDEKTGEIKPLTPIECICGGITKNGEN